jgi:hypothetical protein
MLQSALDSQYLSMQIYAIWIFSKSILKGVGLHAIEAYPKNRTPMDYARSDMLSHCMRIPVVDQTRL